MEKRKCTLLTLDVWDTIIRRKCYPDQIKIETAKRFIEQYGEKFYHKISPQQLAKIRIACEREISIETKKQGFDDEYEIHAVFQRWADKIMNVSSDERKKIADVLYQLELDEELEYAYLDPEIEALIDSIEYKQLAIVSDFYASKEFIIKIIEKCNFNKKIDKEYISCESKWNKRSGNLFEYVRKKENVDYSQWIHIGDNAYSDVEIPTKKGITAIHYLPERETALRKIRKEEFSWKEESVASVGNKKMETFFYGFITWIAEEAMNQQIDTIYFFTREGEFYKQIYDEIKKNNPYNAKMPMAEVLEVSRLATFMPSLREISTQELMRIWNQYSVQSMSALFKSLHVNVDNVESYLKKYGIPKDEVIQYPWQDERVQKLFNDLDFLQYMESERERDRELLFTYFESKGLKKKLKKVAIVDIGWRGTIQDNICYLYPQTEIYGYYIGLIPFLSEQPLNAHKMGYINQYKLCKSVLATMTPFEMFCNSPNGSTVGYKRENNKIYAVRKKEKSEDIIFYTYIKDEQKKIIHKMKDYCFEMKKNGYSSENYRNNAYEALYKYIAYPRRKIVKAYFNLKHNEEFGVGTYVDKTTRFRPKLMIEAVFKRSRRRELIEFLRDTTWAQGYLVKYWLYPALKIYNILLRKYEKE